MAFKAPKKAPQFADLKGILAQTKETDNPLYQVVELLIERLTQLKLVTFDDIQSLKEIVIKEIINPPPVTPTTGAHAPTHVPGGSDVLPMTGPSRLFGSGATFTGFVKEIVLGSGLLMTGDSLGVSGIPESAIVDGTLLARVGSNETITGTWTFTTNPVFNANSIPETAIIDGALLARNAANETITGSWTFTNATVFSNVNPQFFFIETDQAVNNKVWRWIIDAGGFYIQALDDANANPSTVIGATRSANVIQSFGIFTNNVARTSWDVNGKLNHAGGLIFSGASFVTLGSDQTAWNPTGLGTVFSIMLNVTTPCTVRGILAQATGFILHIYNFSGNTLTITHLDASATSTNRIYTPGGVNYSLGPFGSIILRYETGLAGWAFVARA